MVPSLFFFILYFLFPPWEFCNWDGDKFGFPSPVLDIRSLSNAHRLGVSLAWGGVEFASGVRVLRKAQLFLSTGTISRWEWGKIGRLRLLRAMDNGCFIRSWPCVRFRGKLQW
ncbi:hypothetical protein HOY82DRAFT_2013 [Tuber indicum]|nr:hypothetical protein HOY82DRAFT_2013 [Tuber indicum]